LPEREPAFQVSGRVIALKNLLTINYKYGATLAERDHLLEVIDGLKHSIDLRLIRQISFNPETGVLSFVEGNAEHPAPQDLLIHAADHPYFLPIKDSGTATVEYRIAGAEVLESFHLTLQQNVGDYAWDRGTIIRLRQPERLRELIVRQARLVDLGSMVAAISHEIKQPLFTIAMAAESIQIILRKQGELSQSEHIERCAKRITVQVDRARQIIRRILQYGRNVSSTPDRSNPATALEMSSSFLLPLLNERDIKVVMNVTADLPEVSVAPIALEQVLVNAIQNATDSIQSARDAGLIAGQIELYAFPDGGGVRCGVRDDGLGLEKSTNALAFDAFFTTKSVDEGSGMGLFISRQIMNEAAGTITLSANPVAGATLEIWLPPFAEEGAKEETAQSAHID
jgi:two-component system C4-dicarboxylate transport sensor histidine kinase DctB